MTADGHIEKATLIGFVLPFAVLVLLILLFHGHAASPVKQVTGQNTSPTTQVSSAAALPDASEVAAANAAILAYCSNDLRPGTSCALVANSDVTGPGFVESGITESGSFEGVQQVNQGLALAKGSGSSWSVVWNGQQCIPRNIMNTYAVPANFTSCAS